MCPLCKASLHGLRCLECAIEFDCDDGIPVFFTPEPTGNRYREIALFYDRLYETRRDVWKGEGHTAEFTHYVASLVEGCGPKRYLEVGCGEGFLLAAVSAYEKFGMDISRKAIGRARGRTAANFCQGFVERLPFSTGYFDVVANVGVMEHFIDEVAATQEIHRVLRSGGYYLVVLLVQTTLTERCMTKAREFLYPRFHPGHLVRWALAKCLSRDGENVSKDGSRQMAIQPVQNHYTPRRARSIFGRIGFRTTAVITKGHVPDAPLPGHYMRIYVLQKQG